MDTVEEIKQRLSVSEVLASYIQLKPAGRNFRALCPFHHEKTASFMASDEKGIWHCFGCGEGGDIFGFVMKMEGLEFPQALELLANKAGVTLERTARGPSRDQKQQLHDALEQATRFYQAVLIRTKIAQDYLKKRGFSEATIKAWRLGFAPADGMSLSKALRSRSISDQTMSKVGLVRLGRPVRDLFKDRLMIPLSDHMGQITGFTGRVIADGMPKYLNTPQTVLFDKGRMLFGMPQAKEAIRRSGEAVVVEGHLDVIMSHQVGVSNVLASGGTALTIYQLKQLSRLTKQAKLALDQDAAGIVATERAIPLAQSAGVALYIVGLKDAKDPDELIKQSGGTAKWKVAIKNAPYVVDWLLAVLPKQYDLASAMGKKQLTDRVMQTLGRLIDPVEQDHYVRGLAKLVAVEPAVIQRKLNQTSPPVEAAADQVAVYRADARQDAGTAVETALLSLAISYPDTRTSLQDVEPEHFAHPDYALVADYLKTHPDQRIGIDVPSSLRKVENTVRILLLRSEASYADWAALDRRIEAFGLAARLTAVTLKKSLAKLNLAIKQAEVSGNDKLKIELLRQFRDLAKQNR